MQVIINVPVKMVAEKSQLFSVASVADGEWG